MKLLIALMSIASMSLAGPVGNRLRPATPSPGSIQAVDDPSLLATLLAQIHSRAKGRIRSESIADSRSARAFTIPAAGSAAGGGGALFFRSDVTLANYKSTAQDILVGYWPIGTSNDPSAVSTLVRVTIPANRWVTYIDFVASVMHGSGIGSLVFIPYAGSTVDANAAVDGFSRIYTKQPGSQGTVSQEFPAVDIDSLSQQNDAVCLGLRHDAAFRTNYGIVNADDSPHTFHVVFTGERFSADTTVTVPAFGMIQTSAPSGDYGALAVAFTLTDPGPDAISWVAYASSTDNITGDGWVSVASANFSPDQLTAHGD